MALICYSDSNFTGAANFFIKATKIDTTDGGLYYNVACCFSRIGKIDKSFEWLNVAIQKGYNDYQWINNDPDLFNVRQDRRWEEFIKIKK
ncbi:MAG TPA: hypothetical protein PLG25_04035 [bacterium]|nr:hypothetical protein [bacterium]HMZ03341.1 hypothetical protein [bacterium]HNB55332.1 hypothetical protein [bacterium]HND77646.1 hypothetical protein [bacterium]HNE83015.1 hypothetical protein [bacterium]